ncbi:MAG TPA: hypothetical protein VF583_28270 [Bradyrhizobium sp.]
MVSYVGDHQHSNTERHPSAIVTVIDMQTLEEVKNEYECQVEILLHNHPVELKSFKGLWASGEFRRAYVVVQEVTQRFGLVMSSDMNKADEEFFWMYMH